MVQKLKSIREKFQRRAYKALTSYILQERHYPYIESPEAFIKENSKNFSSPENAKLTSLDLGCGTKLRNTFGADEVFGVDIRGNIEDKIIPSDLFTEKIPFGNSEFDFVTAYDFIEHVPRTIIINSNTRFPFVELMSEIYRVLKSDGFFFHRTPAYPAKQAFQDPTHVNIITEDTFPLYFCKQVSGREPLAQMYGFKGSFELIDQRWNSFWIMTLMKKI